MADNSSKHGFAVTVADETIQLLQPLDEDNIADIRRDFQTSITTLRNAVGYLETWRLKMARMVQLLCKGKGEHGQGFSIKLDLLGNEPIMIPAARLTSIDKLLATPLAEELPDEDTAHELSGVVSLKHNKYTLGQAIGIDRAVQVSIRAWRYVLLVHLVHDKNEKRIRPDNQFVVLNVLYERTRQMVQNGEPLNANRRDIKAAGEAYVAAASAANGAPTSQQLRDALFHLYDECVVGAEKLGKRKGGQPQQSPLILVPLLIGQQLLEAQPQQQPVSPSVTPAAPAAATAAPAAPGDAAAEATRYWQQSDQQFSGEATAGTPAAPENVQRCVDRLVQGLCFSPSDVTPIPSGGTAQSLSVLSTSGAPAPGVATTPKGTALP